MNVYMFWIVAGALTLATVALAAWPLWRSRKAAPPTAAHDVAVYKAQLEEVERDVLRGVVSETEAEGARREIARRLLAADAALSEEASFAMAPPRAARLMLLIAAGPLVAVALVTYVLIGAPGRPDHPFAERDIAAERAAMLMTQTEADATAREAGLPEPGPIEAQTADLIERMKAALEERAEDPRGRVLLAEAYLRLGRPAQAWPLFQEAIALSGEAPEPRLYAAMGDSMVQAAGGYVSREAEQAFQQAEGFTISQYMLGAADAQRGSYARAFARWTSLYQTARDQPFAAALRAQIQRIAPGLGEEAVAIADRLPQPVSPDGAAEREAAEGGAAAGEAAEERAAPRGPTAEQMADAARMSPEEQAAMIEGMIANLAARLEEEPEDLEGWAQLLRSYSVLGRSDEKAAALARASEIFDGDPGALLQLRDAAATPTAGSSAPRP